MRNLRVLLLLLQLLVMPLLCQISNEVKVLKVAKQSYFVTSKSTPLCNYFVTAETTAKFILSHVM